MNKAVSDTSTDSIPPAFSQIDDGDLDADSSAEKRLKAKIAREIDLALKGRRLTQVKAAELLGLRQPDVSAIVTGRTGKFSIGRLLRCLDRLDYRVHLTVRPKPPQERRLPWTP